VFFLPQVQAAEQHRSQGQSLRCRCERRDQGGLPKALEPHSPLLRGGGQVLYVGSLVEAPCALGIHTCYTHTHIHTCMCASMHTHKHIHIHTYTHAHMCVHVCMCVCVCMCVHGYTYACMYVCMCVTCMYAQGNSSLQLPWEAAQLSQGPWFWTARLLLCPWNATSRRICCPLCHASLRSKMHCLSQGKYQRISQKRHSVSTHWTEPSSARLCRLAPTRALLADSPMWRALRRTLRTNIASWARPLRIGPRVSCIPPSLVATGAPRRQLLLVLSSMAEFRAASPHCSRL
jgi:hypothetical protein